MMNNPTHTIDARVQQFTDALEQMEASRQVEPMLKFFSSDAELRSISLHQPLKGPDGVRKFWTDYLAIFQSVKSEFTHIHANGDLAVLEWKSEGMLPGDVAISYQGVSILEFTADKICRFRTCYDSAAFLADGAKLLGRHAV